MLYVSHFDGDLSHLKVARHQTNRSMHQVVVMLGVIMSLRLCHDRGRCDGRISIDAIVVACSRAQTPGNVLVNFMDANSHRLFRDRILKDNKS